MAVKTKPRPPRRTSSYRPRRDPSAGRPRRNKPRRKGGVLAISQQVLLGLLVGAGVIVVLGVVFSGPLVNVLETVLRGVGLGAVLLVVAAALDASVALRRPQLTSDFLRTLAGGHLLLVFGFGVLGLFSPGWSIGDAHFGDVTLGGDAGGWVGRRPRAVVGV